MADKTQDREIDRIVFKEVLDGDRLKFIAQANITQNGGGARDLRFRGWDVMEPTLRALFPTTKVVKRKRAGDVDLDIYSGRFHWIRQDGSETSKEALLEPPTRARENEGRITRVHEYACFTIREPGEGSGRLLVLFIQRPDGSVWPFVVTERSLEHDKWDPAVAEFLLSALRAKRRKGNAAYGFIDFTTGEKLVR